MRTIDFSSILHEAAQVCGLDRSNLTDADFAMIRDFADQRLQLVWESDRWPELIRFVPVLPNSKISSASNVGNSIKFTVTNYAAPVSAGETIEVFHCENTTENNVVNTQHTVASVTGSAPTWVVTTTTATTVSAYTVNETNAFLKRTTDPYLIDLDNGITSALSSEPVGEVLELWSADPRLIRSAQPVMDGIVHADGIAYAVSKTGAKVWLEYRVRSPRLRGDAWNSKISYSAGAQCWFDAGGQTSLYVPSPGKLMLGNFYTCVSATASGQSPASSPTKWEVVKIPHIFWKYLTRGIEADYLRSEQQYDQAAAAESDAEGLRIMEVDKQMRQSGQMRRMKMEFTY